MTRDHLCDAYRHYIACLNSRDLARLDGFVDQDVEYDGKRIGLGGYRQMLEGDFQGIPDLQFKIDFLVSDPPTIGCRLVFDCTPAGELFGMPVKGRRVQFSENVFYKYSSSLIVKVWSVIDKAAISLHS